MYTNINFSGFCDTFRSYGRNDSFSYEGKRALFDYLEGYEEDTGEKIELDVIALCVDFSEEPIVDVLENYDMDSLEELEENTLVLMVNEDTIIYQSF